MKINIRALVVVLFIALMLILSIPFMLIAFVAGYINMGVRDRIAQIVIKVIANGVSFLCGTTRTVTVSYTHLDVYKRQGNSGLIFRPLFFVFIDLSGS